MKFQQSNKNHYKKLILALILSLTSCDNPINISSSKYFGRVNSRTLKDEIHYAYLGCYALNEENKKECLSELKDKYIEKCYAQDEEYVQAFQFESEKLGFKHFLNDLKLPCESIKEGPEFVSNEQAYLVKCTSSQQYYMQFDYNKKEWLLVKKGNNE